VGNEEERREGGREGGESTSRYEIKKNTKTETENKRLKNAKASSQSHSTRHESQVKEIKSVSLAAFLLLFHLDLCALSSLCLFCRLSFFSSTFFSSSPNTSPPFLPTPISIYTLSTPYTSGKALKWGVAASSPVAAILSLASTTRDSAS